MSKKWYLLTLYLSSYPTIIWTDSATIIQEIMRAIKPAAEKYKKVCKDFPNFSILTNSVTPGELQLTFVHMTVGNKSVGGSIVAFGIEGYLSSPSVASVKIDIAFSADGDKIRLPIADFLLCTDAGNLARSKKQQYWTPRNAFLHPPFLTEIAILHEESNVGELLKIFSRSITEWAEE